MSDPDMIRWANRRVSHGEPGRAAAPAPILPPPAAAPQAALPPPPAGWAYAFSPQHQAFILVPMAPAYPQPQPYAPQASPPAPRPPVAPPQGGYGRVIPLPQRVKSCELVKPGNVDPWADFLATVPDLVPPTNGYDAMAGQVSPETQAEIAPFLAEFGADFNAPVQVRGAGPSVSVTPELGSRPLPPDPNTEGGT